MKEIETIHGFDIPKRQLTEEEFNMEVTLERFNEFHYEVGEDFCDQFEPFFNEKVLGGYLLCKYPEKAEEIIEIINEGFLTDFGSDVYEDEDGFYTDLAEFINLTVHLKRRVNEVLIIIKEYYAD